MISAWTDEVKLSKMLCVDNLSLRCVISIEGVRKFARFVSRRIFSMFRDSLNIESELNDLFLHFFLYLLLYLFIYIFI